MKPRNQARIALRTKMAARDMKITELAKLIGHSRENVSRAINHGRCPRVLAKIKGVLRA